jgi:uncharacterized membrane protein YfcA
VSFGVEAAAGFGSMVIALTVGAWWFDLDALLGWLVPVNLVLSLYLVARGRASLDVRFLTRTGLPLMLLGLALGTALATALVNSRWPRVLFAVFVVLAAAWQLPAKEPSTLRSPWREGALLLAGVVHGLFATGGPLAVLVATRELPDKQTFRATLSAVWVVLNALVLPRLVHEGVLSWASLQVSALLLVPLALGIAVGEWVHRSLDERRFRFSVASLLLVAGVTLTVKSVAT